MSQKRKVQRAKHEAKEAQEGRKVVNWIFGVLVALAVCFLIYSVFIVS